MESSNKQRMGISLCIITFAIVQAILRLVKSSNLVDSIAIGVVMTVGIVLSVSIVLENNKLNIKERIIGPILIMTTCILFSLIGLIVQSSDEQFEIYKTSITIIFISAPLSFIALMVFCAILRKNLIT